MVHLLEMAIEGGPTDADHFSDLREMHAAVAHAFRLFDSRRRHLGWTPADTATLTGRGESDLSPFTDEVAFELSDRSKDRED